MNTRTGLYEMPFAFWSRIGQWIAPFFSREKWGENLGLIIVLVSAISGFLTYVLVSDNLIIRNKIGGVYWLVAIDSALLLALTYVVGRRAWDVWTRRRQQAAGAQLHIQLVSIFSILAAIPALILAIFAMAFIHIGIQSWFGETIRTAVTESQEVAQAYLKEHQQSISTDVLAMASDLNREAVKLRANENFLDEYFRTQAFLRNLSEAILIDSNGKVIEEAGISFSIQILPTGFKDLIQQAQSGKPVLLVGENDDRVRALVKLDNFVDTYLFVGRFVDEKVLSSVSSTDKAVRDYRTLEQSQNKLKLSMTLIFCLVALMLLLVAIWTGLSLAERLVSPVIRLIQASERIRSGDLNARVEVDNNESELTMLARSFNRMTDQLGTQRRDLINANRQLDERRRFTETVLAGVNAGILGMDANGVIQIANASAQKLLNQSAAELVGKKLSEVSSEIEKVRRLVRSKPGRSVETPIDITIGTKPSHWIVRMTAEGQEDDLRGFVATFDDLSPMMEAQRKAAWADVARRVAHEIKNPLTPIQLSAERLKRRYSKVIAEEDREIFEVCTDTIIRHVSDIRHMVDEFSAFARLPNATKRPENMVTLCQQVMVLFQQGHSNVSFRFDRPEHAVPLMADRQQMTQALTNLVKNAYESTVEKKEKQGDDYQGVITLALKQTDTNVMISVSDNGMGWPKDIVFKLTDPYVTTKATGTGLGLSIVSKIIEDHKGTMEMSENIPEGATITMIFPKGETQNG